MPTIYFLLFKISTALNYFTSLYLICVITTNKTSIKPNFHQAISFEYDQTENSKKVFQQSIDLGCQAFVISDDVFELFLEDFHELHDVCIQVFPKKHILVYSDLVTIKNNSIDGALKNPSIDGNIVNSNKLFKTSIIKVYNFTDLPNILFLYFNVNSQRAKFSTTKFGEKNSELYDLAEIQIDNGDSIEDLLSGINLFPEKLH